MTGVLLVLVIVAFAVGQVRKSAGDDAHAHRELDRKEVAAIASGDQAALGRVYDRFHRLVFSLALRVLGDRTAAEEVSQDVFLRLWYRAGDFDPTRGELLGWLVTVTRNRAIDTLRSRQHREFSAWTPMPESLDTAGWLATPPATAAIEASQRVSKMLESLGEPQRRIIEMSYYEGHTQPEIAELLQLPLGTVKTWTRSALAALREACG